MLVGEGDVAAEQRSDLRMGRRDTPAHGAGPRVGAFDGEGRVRRGRDLPGRGRRGRPREAAQPWTGQPVDAEAGEGAAVAPEPRSPWRRTHRQSSPCPARSWPGRPVLDRPSRPRRRRSGRSPSRSSGRSPHRRAQRRAGPRPCRPARAGRRRRQGCPTSGRGRASSTSAAGSRALVPRPRRSPRRGRATRAPSTRRGADQTEAARAERRGTACRRVGHDDGGLFPPRDCTRVDADALEPDERAVRPAAGDEREHDPVVDDRRRHDPRRDARERTPAGNARAAAASAAATPSFTASSQRRGSVGAQATGAGSSPAAA